MKLTEDLFKKLAVPLCKNKNKKPKKYSKSYYQSFKRYLDIHNFNFIIDDKNFEKYFLDFCRIEFGDDENARLDFSDKTKLDLLKSSGGCCAVCGTLTIFPLKGNNSESLTIGAACHIRPASLYGPRYDISHRAQNISEISSMENGIWACLNCHKEIDIDSNLYTITYLKELKKSHELEILKIKESRLDIRKLINSFEKSNNSDYIYINRKQHEDSEILNKDLTKKLIETYSELKEIEKETIKKISLFKLINHLDFKKNEEFKRLNIKMGKERISLFGELKDTDKSLEELKKYYEKEIEENLKYEHKKLEIKKYNRKNDMVKEISDYSQIFQLFIIDKSEEIIVPIIINNLKAIECMTGLVRLAIEIEKDFLYIDLDKTEDGNTVEVVSNDLKNFLCFISFIDKFENFKTEETFIMVRYNEKIFTIDLSLIKK